MTRRAHEPGRVREHDDEPVAGLPERLPAGETLLWQGAPDAWVAARRVFHLPLLAAYFGLMLAVVAGVGISAGQGPGEILSDALPLLGLAGVALATLGAIAWLTARTTLYTITNRRVVMRIGVALSLTVNLPFRLIDAAALRRHANGSGDLILHLSPGERPAYLLLWPHVRPWRLARPEPMLRALRDVGAPAELLAGALAAAVTPRAPEHVQALPERRRAVAAVA